MKTIGCQFNKISGPDATSSYKIEFTVDESQRKAIQQLLEYRKGTSILLMLFDVDADKTELTDLAQETEDTLVKRLNKQMHAIISNIAADKKIDKSIIKQQLKDYLIRRDLIVESTAELDKNGYAVAIYYLNNEF